MGPVSVGDEPGQSRGVTSAAGTLEGSSLPPATRREEPIRLQTCPWTADESASLPAGTWPHTPACHAGHMPVLGFFPRLPRASLVIKTGLGQRFKGLAHHRLPFGALPQRGRAGPFDPELTQRPFAMALPTPTSSVSRPHPGTPGPSPCPRGPGPNAAYAGSGMCPSRGRVLTAPLEVTGRSVSIHLAPPAHS